MLLKTKDIACRYQVCKAPQANFLTVLERIAIFGLDKSPHGPQGVYLKESRDARKCRRFVPFPGFWGSSMLGPGSPSFQHAAGPTRQPRLENHGLLRWFLHERESSRRSTPYQRRAIGIQAYFHSRRHGIP